MLTVKTVAERLGVSEALVYGLCAARKIRHERHGLGRGKILIPEDALEEYRKSVTVGVGASIPPASPPPPKNEPLKLRHIDLNRSLF